LRQVRAGDEGGESMVAGSTSTGITPPAPRRRPPLSDLIAMLIIAVMRRMATARSVAPPPGPKPQGRAFALGETHPGAKSLQRGAFSGQHTHSGLPVRYIATAGLRAGGGAFVPTMYAVLTPALAKAARRRDHGSRFAVRGVGRAVDRGLGLPHRTWRGCQRTRLCSGCSPRGRPVHRRGTLRRRGCGLLPGRATRGPGVGAGTRAAPLRVREPGLR
jgi:hypothetical protein